MIWVGKLGAIAIAAVGANGMVVMMISAAMMGLSMVMVFGKFLAGAGDTLPPMSFELMNMWVIILPLSLLPPRFTELGMYGVRWAIT